LRQLQGSPFRDRLETPARPELKDHAVAELNPIRRTIRFPRLQPVRARRSRVRLRNLGFEPEVPSLRHSEAESLALSLGVQFPREGEQGQGEANEAAGMGTHGLFTTA